MLPTFRLSATYSLIYGLCKVVTCQTAAHTHLDSTFHFEVINESYYHTFRSAYFWNPSSGLRKILRTFRLSLAKSLLYGLWKMVTCLIAAHIHQDATFEFEVIDENDYDNSRSAYFFEILPVAYVRFYQHFVYLWRISWFAASGRWSRTLLHIPQRDFSCWRKSGNWLNLLDLCTLLKSYLQPIRKAIARQSRDFAIDKRNVGNILRRPEVGFQKYADLELG